MRILTFIIAILCLSLSFSHIAEAKRFGGGRSYGHSYSQPSASKSTSNARSGIGGILAAGAIGALLGYFFGGGSGSILLLIIFALIAFLVLRKRFRNNPTATSQRQAQSGINLNKQNQNLPDGTPKLVFEQQAQNLFYQFQEKNTPENVEMLKGYLTAEFFNAIKSEIINNDEVAQFQSLQFQLINFKQQGQTWIGSVRISGEVKENAQSPWENFSETWHYSREPNEHIWRLCGIQQN